MDGAADDPDRIEISHFHKWSPRFIQLFHIRPLGNNWQFAFNVKFYPPDPSLLTEDITR